MSAHFPAEFPKDCILDLAKIVMRRDPAALISAETTDHALYAAGCFNAMRFDSGPQPVGAWWTPLLPFAQALILKFIAEYLSQPKPAFADGLEVDCSDYTVEQLADELQSKLAD